MTLVEGGGGFPPFSAGEPAMSSQFSNFVAPIQRTNDGESYMMAKVTQASMMEKLDDDMAVQILFPSRRIFPWLCLSISLRSLLPCFRLSFFTTAATPSPRVILSSHQPPSSDQAPGFFRELPIGRNTFSPSFPLSIHPHDLETKAEPPKLKMVDIQLNNEGADDSIPLFTPEKGMTSPNENIQQMQTALRELLERQTREAEIATEAMKRMEATAARQQALLEEAEKRNRELKARLSNKLVHSDDDEVESGSRSRTWKPSIVVQNPPAKENSRHPFSLAILSEELPKKFKYPTDMEPCDGSNDPKHHLDAFDNRMVLMNASDATKCKAFSVTFKKDALTWFNSLAPGSIKSFSDLSGGFLRNFTTRRRLPKTCLNLYSIV
ncbi:hypothetical protein PIB30_062534 [Stylosanthes scabra]|uniref:Retrotransposon gag domain-containing protein n=1 Tax=Stylosanthes scabra TaxID=79078 RepID=A0ABU6SMY2_9FABA|nr:hypothetical protein [Stylosanthes scabra]